MKCVKCGATSTRLAYSSLTGCLTNPNQVKRISHYICNQCGHRNKVREIFTLSSVEEINNKGRDYI